MLVFVLSTVIKVKLRVIIIVVLMMSVVTVMGIVVIVVVVKDLRSEPRITVNVRGIG